MGTGFCKLPTALFTDEQYSDLSLNAKVLYALLLDRMELSVKNDWREGQSIYVIFTIEEIRKYLSCSKGTAIQTLSELEDKLLVRKKKRGRGEADLLFVKPYNFSKADKKSKEKQTSRSSKNEPQEVQNLDSVEVQNLDSIYTYNPFEPNTIDKSSSLSVSKSLGKEKDVEQEYADTINYLRSAVGYSIISATRHSSGVQDPIPVIDEILSFIAETIVLDKGMTKICGQEKPMSVVKATLMKIDSGKLSEIHSRLTKSHVILSKTPDAMRRYVVSVAYDVCSSYNLASGFQFNRDLGDYENIAL